ncbi:uncharacterized protein LOC113762774 [Coffea eugenioides]|uniref:Uncharacterized protein n=1 Tax=Coffea arabica TaxID=13443 RepID=A0A6P6WDA0_COFAR|nr:uncharacterized protein LOC113732021 isoform X2 [Coffea arabica]XP_027162168.1 uncharacterized protein LOC113762774 [Coffea eugenioides]
MAKLQLLGRNIGRLFTFGHLSSDLGVSSVRGRTALAPATARNFCTQLPPPPPPREKWRIRSLVKSIDETRLSCIIAFFGSAFLFYIFMEDEIMDRRQIKEGVCQKDGT